MTAPSLAVWDEVVALLAGAQQVALACHVDPDGDALGSMLALGAGLRRRGVDVVASWGGEPFEVPAAYSFLPAVDLLVPAADFPHSPDLLVTLDSGSPDRLGSLADRIGRAGRTVVIDHHANGVAYGDLRLVDDGAAATVVLVAELLDRLGIVLDVETATPLYTGLVTDTGSFKYLATTPAVHQLAARLLATGIRHDLISRAIYDTAPFGYVQLLGRACGRARLEPAAVGGLGLVWTVVEPADYDGTGLGLAEVEGVIDVLRVSAEAEVAVVLKADPVKGGWKVSTRSKGAIDVGAVCGALGGGGHRFAAGFSTSAAVDVVVTQVRAALALAPHLAP
ncbi:MAG: bifunctional oligoribonuclease/PAP phosphatase NrnA [Frankiales bacterium]|nr:bifunctional oligoribonuclease/PAP phosphatase NrnA [Frankiales bacterium]